MKNFITDTSAWLRAGLPAGLGEGARLELGLRAGRLPRVTRAGRRHDCTRATDADLADPGPVATCALQAQGLSGHSGWRGAVLREVTLPRVHTAGVPLQPAGPMGGRQKGGPGGGLAHRPYARDCLALDFTGRCPLVGTPAVIPRSPWLQ